MKRTKPSAAGFTQVELLVGLTILGMILAGVIAARPKAAAPRVAVSAQTLATTLQLARARAVKGNMEVVFRIDLKEGRFGVSKAMHRFPAGTEVSLKTSESERSDGGGGIRFYPDGQSSGGEIALTLEGRSVRVAVNWLTGEPRLIR